MIEPKEISLLCSKHGASYADVRIAEVRTQVISSDQKNTNMSDNMFSGFGVRVFKKGSVGFSYGTDLKKFKKVFTGAVKIAQESNRKAPKFQEREPVQDRYAREVKIDPFEVDDSEKLDWTNSFKKELRSKLVKDVNAAMLFSEMKKTLVDSSGNNTTQNVIRSMAAASIVGSKGDAIHSVSFRKSDSLGYEMISGIDLSRESDSLKKKLANTLSAKRAPAGKFTVVCDPKLTGLFFHEAVGHACEADYILNKASVFWDKLGAVVAAGSVKLIDDPNQISWGHYRYDDEGTLARETKLIHEGVLTGYLHTRETAAEMGVDPTGNGRAMSTEVIPIPRMSVLKLDTGDMSLDEMKSMNNTILANGFTGGEVDLVTGNFIFGCEEAFLNKDGKETPLRDVAFSGNILEILKNVVGIGDELKQTYTGGMCGKKGQSVPVSEIMPYMAVAGVYVGGEGN
jgi:TldD protein